MTETKVRLLHPERESTPFVPTPKSGSRAFSGLLLAAHRHEDFVQARSGVVFVPSRSNPFKRWTVDPEEGTCNCPIYLWGDPETRIKGFCHHVAAADAWLAWIGRVGEGFAYRIRERRDPVLGIPVFFVDECSEEGWSEYVADRDGFVREVVAYEREVAHAVSFEAALLEVVERMAGVA